MRIAVAVLLMACALPAQEEEGLVFGKQPVACAPIECETRVPNGWKVAQDHTGLSAQGKGAQGDGMGFVITREPLLEDAKTFGASWAEVLAKAGKPIEVKSVRAGRYRAFFASWPASGRTIAVYRIHVPDQEYLYNVSFSTPKDAADREALVQGVLKSFKCTSKKGKLALQETSVEIGSAATIRLPEGFEAKKHPRLRVVYFVKLRRGYPTRQEAGVIYLFPTDARRRPEDTNLQLIAQLGRLGLKFGNDFKSKDATYGGFKGEGKAGTVIGTEGETYSTYVWSGKKKRKGASVILVIHEREMRLHKKYFATVLKSLKAQK